MVRIIKFLNGDVTDERHVIEGCFTFNEENTELVVDRFAYDKEKKGKMLEHYTLRLKKTEDWANFYTAYKK